MAGRGGGGGKREFSMEFEEVLRRDGGKKIVFGTLTDS